MHFLAKLSSHKGWGSLILRLGVGGIFLFHGIQKWSLWTAAPDQMQPSLLSLMKFLSVVEPLGGLALVLGFLTPLAALGLAIIMVGAIYFKIQVWNFPFAAANATGWEFDLSLLLSCLALMLSGAGKWSADEALMKH